MALPQLSGEEKLAALKKAQEMRSKRKEIREKLKAGSMRIDEIIDLAEDELYGKMRVVYLLESLPRVGKTRAQKIMTEIGIDLSRRVKGLGQRQKDALLNKLAK